MKAKLQASKLQAPEKHQIPNTNPDSSGLRRLSIERPGGLRPGTAAVRFFISPISDLIQRWADRGLSRAAPLVMAV